MKPSLRSTRSSCTRRIFCVRPACACCTRCEMCIRDSSNLARGCEKQYKEQEAALFREIADYLSAAQPPVADPSLDKLLELIRRDLHEGYPDLRAAAEVAGDRGTQRICVWGEKVTRMLESLVSRYQRDGEAFLKDTQVWVCTVCGFIYVGDSAPQLCPVCKVPAWKFEKVEGRD